MTLAEARLRQSQLNLDYTNIMSPSHGFVTRKKVEPGQMVSRGQPVMAIVTIEPGRDLGNSQFQRNAVAFGQTRSTCEHESGYVSRSNFQWKS